MIIYFDETLINNDLVYGLCESATLFNRCFELGRTVCRTFTLKVDKSLTVPTNVKIDDYDLIVYSVDTQDNSYNVLELADKMLNLNIKLDYSNMPIKSVSNILSAISENNNITIDSIPEEIEEIEIPYYSYLTQRDLIGFVAELMGCFALFEGQNLHFREFFADTHSISYENVADLQIGEKHTITRVFLELGVYSYESGTDEGETVYLNPQNVLFTGDIQTQLDNILSVINGLSFYNIDVNRCTIPDFEVGDEIVFTDGVESYNTIAQCNLNYYGQFIGGFSCILETNTQQETRLLTRGEIASNRLEIKVDRENGILTQQIENTNERVDDTNNRLTTTEGNVSTLTQTATNIQANFKNYVAKEDENYQELITNITFDNEGINIGSSNVETNLQLSASGVAIKNGLNNVATMEAKQFTTGNWVMAQDGNVFNIFKKG